jgi:hypothetical protein
MDFRCFDAEIPALIAHLLNTHAQPVADRCATGMNAKESDYAIS